MILQTIIATSLKSYAIVRRSLPSTVIVPSASSQSKALVSAVSHDS
jgi:hypothetical protein